MPDRLDRIRPPAPGSGSGGSPASARSSRSWASPAAGSPASAARAIDYPPTRSAARRPLAVALAVLLVGLGSLVGAGATANLVDGHGQWLAQHGVKTAGVIVEVGADTRLHPGDARVIYLVTGRVLNGIQSLGADAAKFHPAERVTVYYDPSRPSDFTIAGEDNQPAWSVWVMVFLICLAVLTFPGGILLVQTVRLRRVLAGAPWRQAGIRYRADGNCVVVQVAGSPVVPASGGDQAGVFRTGLLSRSGPSAAERVFAKLALGRTAADGGGPHRDSFGTVWVAGPSGRRAVLARADGRGFVLLTGPRSRERRDQWIRLLTS